MDFHSFAQLAACVRNEGLKIWCCLALALAGQIGTQAQTNSTSVPPSSATTPQISPATSASEGTIGSVVWAGSAFVPQNLGPQKLDEKTFVKLADYPCGLAFQVNGDLLATIGSGTEPDMRIEKWTGTVPSTWVRFQWHDYTAADFKDAEKMKERVEGETHGIFWFFAGPLAVDGKDQVFFNLGSCGPNGLYQLLQPDPIKVRMLFPSGGFQTLQFYPNDSENLYATSFSTIEKMTPPEPGPKENAVPVFSIFGGHARLLDTLMIDQDHLLATLILSRPATGGAAQKRPPPQFMAVAFDRKLKGYYVLDIKRWGPMAIRPTDKALFRFDADAKEIRQFNLLFFASADNSPPPKTSSAINAASSASQPGLDAGAILFQARAAYAALTSYSDNGTMATRMGSFSQDGTFTTRMQRPSLYRIAWTGTGISGGGVVWSDGTGDYLRFAGKADEKQKDRTTALAGATGISSNAASMIPAAFFHEQWGDVLSGVGDCQVLPDEPVDNVTCRVVTSVIPARGTKIRMKLWIGDADHLIHKFEETMSGPPAMPALSDATVTSMLKQQNKPVTPEAIAALRKQLTTARDMANKMMQKGGVVFTQVHHNIQTNQAFDLTPKNRTG